MCMFYFLAYSLNRTIKIWVPIPQPGIWYSFLFILKEYMGLFNFLTSIILDYLKVNLEGILSNHLLWCSEINFSYLLKYIKSFLQIIVKVNFSHGLSNFYTLFPFNCPLAIFLCCLLFSLVTLSYTKRLSIDIGVIVNFAVIFEQWLLSCHAL
jgi:hypothetical protein